MSSVLDEKSHIKIRAQTLKLYRTIFVIFGNLLNSVSFHCVILKRAMIIIVPNS